MKPRTKAVTAAITGTALGLTGLAAVAMPAGAQDAPPELPAISADELVGSVAGAEPSALAGTVAVENNLGLPALPGLDALDAGSARVYSDGEGRSKVSLEKPGAEQTIVHDGTTVWNYDSADNSATKITLPEGAAQGGPAEGEMADPAQAAAALLAHVQETSTVAVDGTAMVADRPAYELVLTPKPTERTLLREIRVAVDAQTRTPLQLSVLTNGTTDPALQIGFTDVSFAEQPADLFTFTPPEGVKVTEKQPGAESASSPDEAAMVEGADLKLVGDGWDTVVTAKVPAVMLDARRLPAAGSEDAGTDRGQPIESPRALLEQFGKPVSGEFGTGHVITTKVGTALIAEDGRIAAGAVPEQVLIDALSQR